MVNLLASEMARGRWKLNGDPIRFSRDGRLLDGQHRLWACVESGESFASVVVMDLDVNVFTTIDQGKRRSPADHLVVAGHDLKGYQTRLASTASLVMRYRVGLVFSNERHDPESLIETLDREPTIKDWVMRMTKAGTGYKGFAAPVAATLHIASAKQQNRAAEFADQFLSGAVSDVHSPVLVLRNRIINNPPNRAWERFFIVVSAWNHFAKGHPMSKIGALRSPEFPKIVGDK